VQLAGGVYAVVKGVGLQLLSQNAANSLCPAPQSMPPDIVQDLLLFAATRVLDSGESISALVAGRIRKLRTAAFR
jgi:hypothetical protein